MKTTMKPKLKNYEVTIRAVSVVCVIGAKNEAEATEFAQEAVSTFDWEVCEMDATQLKTEDALENSKSCANAVSGDDQ